MTPFAQAMIAYASSPEGRVAIMTTAVSIASAALGAAIAGALNKRSTTVVHNVALPPRSIVEVRQVGDVTKIDARPAPEPTPNKLDVETVSPLMQSAMATPRGLDITPETSEIQRLRDIIDANAGALGQGLERVDAVARQGQAAENAFRDHRKDVNALLERIMERVVENHSTMGTRVDTLLTRVSDCEGGLRRRRGLFEKG